MWFPIFGTESDTCLLHGDVVRIPLAATGQYSAHPPTPPIRTAGVGDFSSSLDVTIFLTSPAVGVQPPSVRAATARWQTRYPLRETKSVRSALLAPASTFSCVPSFGSRCFLSSWVALSGQATATASAVQPATPRPWGRFLSGLCSTAQKRERKSAR